MKQFNLEEYLKNPSRKVVTRSGRDVRIICTDKKGCFCIVALVSDGDEEDTYTYDSNGTRQLSLDSDRDLVFAPIKHEGWINLYKDGDKVAIGTIYPFRSEKDAKKASNDEGYDGYVATCKITWEE